MSVSEEQWAAAAEDRGVTLDELRGRIAAIDGDDVSERVSALTHRPVAFDQQGDPLTLGEWAMLYDSRSYRFMAETVLPNRYWIATIWQGLNERFDDPPIVLETGVFLLDVDGTDLPPPSRIERHRSEQEAFEAHERLVAQFAQPR